MVDGRKNIGVPSLFVLIAKQVTGHSKLEVTWMRKERQILRMIPDISDFFQVSIQ